ncbi:hypothetical protein A2865_00395 [Candidatus Woesebacteria bacterium RIFCSPHIGHO2_01_FULL_39_17]|nr:MAG: hypothetical protein UT19_C0001G0108 [Candidatus Woesebacteria bacterium GW2011_GWB1_39_10b]KKR11482.1 MAG: hypothetical protein UT40_C0035G0005 [Candidatus Woesebacteria bacterium GW2011_GWA1_39_21b]OGM23071.1 MAG: hypothetical protein A2865_00395 [Candidatus Woesebacteria bacterium RIFCSPHIGHO2_01_FULL_39_17]
MRVIGTHKPVAIILPNYNMPEAADALGDYIEKFIKYPHKLIVIDNGSDITPPSKYTSIKVSENLQTTAGWLLGLSVADYLEIKHSLKFFAYWILITSTSFPNGKADILSPLVKFLVKNPKAVAIAHSLTKDSTTGWKHLYDRGTGKPRRTWMLDNISTLYRADWFNKIGRFDPKMYMAWGSDLETSYIARSQGKSLWVYDGICAKKVTDTAYKMNRMHLSSRKRRSLATKNMEEVMIFKYGENWNKIMRNKYVYPKWR